MTRQQPHYCRAYLAGSLESASQVNEIAESVSESDLALTFGNKLSILVSGILRSKIDKVLAPRLTTKLMPASNAH